MLFLIFYLGHKSANVLTGRGKRDIIKNIIINSDSPTETIELLKKCGVGKALDYAELINSMKSDPQWKQRILKKINITNGTVTGVGAIAGSAAGQVLGGAAGAYLNSRKDFKNLNNMIPNNMY